MWKHGSLVTRPLDQSTNLGIRFSLGRVISLSVALSIEVKLEGRVLHLTHNIQDTIRQENTVFSNARQKISR